MARIFPNTPTSRAALAADIVALLGHPYRLYNGHEIKGNSVSSLQDHLRDRWRGLSNYNRFIDTCEKLGFKVARGRNDRGTPAQVVYRDAAQCQSAS